MKDLLIQKKKRLVIFLSIVSCLLFSHYTSGESLGNSQFVTATVNAIPQPMENEFTNPEQVLNVFIHAVQTNNIDEGMKCFPIQEIYTHSTLDTRIETLKYFSLTSNSPIPDLKLFNLDLAMKNFKDIWRQLISFAILYGEDPNILHGIIFDKDAQIRAEQLQQLKRALDLSKLKNIEYQGIQKIEKNLRVTPVDQEIGVVEKQRVDVTLTIYQQEIPVSFFVVKIQSNWRIFYAKASFEEVN